jgi:hypothetical protein
MTAKQAGPHGRDFAFAVLVVECINNTQPLVVLSKDPVVPFLHHQEIKVAGLPVKVPVTRHGWLGLSDVCKMQEYHHYCRGRVGTQFCSL